MADDEQVDGADLHDDQAESAMVYQRDEGGYYGVYVLRYPPTQ